MASKTVEEEKNSLPPGQAGLSGRKSCTWKSGVPFGFLGWLEKEVGFNLAKALNGGLLGCESR
jgi:hypothetical protein